MLLVPVIIICSFNSYKFLSYLSIPSIFIAISGMFCIFYYSFQQVALNKTSQSRLEIFNIEAILGRLGIAMYLFDGNAVVVNINAESGKNTNYKRILKRATIFTLCLFIVFATICYSVYREETMPIFTMNLDPLSPLALVIFFCVCINALTSYPIQILVAFAIVEKSDFFVSDTKLKRMLKVIALRSFVIIITTSVCMFITTFTDFLNIAGSIGSATVAFILPSLFYLKY